jgi:hypothetical protein
MNEGERVRRVDRKGGEHREDVVEKVLLEPRHFGIGEVGRLDEDDAFVLERVAQLAPAPLLVERQGGDLGLDPGQLLLRGEPVLRHGGHARADLSREAGNADHEELVEVVGRNRQEAQLLEQRMVVVGRLLEDTPVELQPRQLAVDEALRRRAQGLARRLPTGLRTRGDLVEILGLVEGKFSAQRHASRSPLPAVSVPWPDTPCLRRHHDEQNLLNSRAQSKFVHAPRNARQKTGGANGWAEARSWSNGGRDTFEGAAPCPTTSCDCRRALAGLPGRTSPPNRPSRSPSRPRPSSPY